MARPKIKGNLKALNVKIDASVYDRLDNESLKSGVPKTVITEKAIDEYLKKKDKKKKGTY